MNTTTCPGCGEEMPVLTKKGKRRSFCTGICAFRNGFQPSIKQCAMCRQEFQDKAFGQRKKFCSIRCRDQYYSIYGVNTPNNCRHCPRVGVKMNTKFMCCICANRKFRNGSCSVLRNVGTKKKPCDTPLRKISGGHAYCPYHELRELRVINDRFLEVMLVCNKTSRTRVVYKPKTSLILTPYSNRKLGSYAKDGQCVVLVDQRAFILGGTSEAIAVSGEDPDDRLKGYGTWLLNVYHFKNPYSLHLFADFLAAATRVEGLKTVPDILTEMGLERGRGPRTGKSFRRRKGCVAWETAQTRVLRYFRRLSSWRVPYTKDLEISYRPKSGEHKKVSVYRFDPMVLEVLIKVTEEVYEKYLAKTTW